jgi:hypothetical protein
MPVEPLPVEPPLAKPAHSAPLPAAVPLSAPVAALPELPSLPTRLIELFHLGEAEQRLLRVLLADGSAGLTLHKLAGAARVEVPRLLADLLPEGTLRRHALVEVDADAELGCLRPADLVRPARGLELWCSASSPLPAEPALIASQLPGLLLLQPPPPETAWAEELRTEKPPPQLMELARERLVAPHPVLLGLSGTSPEAALQLAQAARLRLQRPVLFLDGTALFGWPLAQLTAALRRVRRDADLRGAAIVVSEAGQLGSSVRALCGPRPAGQTAPVVLCGAGTVALPGALPPASRAEAALVPTVASLRPAAPAPGAAASSAAGAETEDPAVLASRDEARRRAALDAARAMGKPIPADLIAAASPPTPVASTVVAAARPAAAAPAPAPKPAPPPPPPSTEPAPEPVGRPRNPRLAAALAKAGLPPIGAAGHAAVRESAPEAEPASRPAPAPEAALAPEAAPTPAAAPATSELASELLPDDQPPLPLDDDASLDDLLRTARNTPNHAQRRSVLQRLAGMKAPAVIQIFRQFTTSPHPGVRAAAEAGMASVFGPNWNRTRAIAPPVQPPRSDDSGRGPGGAF